MKRKVLLIVYGLFLTGCGRSESPETVVQTSWRADWVVESHLDFKRGGNMSVDSFRLAVPYKADALYGQPTSGYYDDAVFHRNYAFHIDLNRGHDAMLATLGETAFYDREMQIEPPEARLARVFPEVADMDGNSLGVTNWVNEATGHTLMLSYVDRPARITGPGFDINIVEAGYHWIEIPPRPALAHVIPEPKELELVFYAK